MTYTPTPCNCTAWKCRHNTVKAMDEKQKQIPEDDPAMAEALLKIFQMISARCDELERRLLDISDRIHRKP